MRIVICTPFASLTPESGLIYLLARYLSDVYPQVTQLTCNGAFSACDRDCQTGWKRTLGGCPYCMQEQRELAEWSRAESRDISQFLAPEEVQQTKRWVSAQPAALLLKARFRGIPAYDICRASLEKRLGNAEPDIQNKKHEQLLRRYLLSALRMCCAVRRFNNHVRPDITLIAGGSDFITQAYLHQSAEQGREVAAFRWDMSSRCVRITHPRTGQIGSSELIVEEVTRMRNDYKTWPLEFLTVLEDLLNFLNIPAAQLSLPMAK